MTEYQLLGSIDFYGEYCKCQNSTGMQGQVAVLADNGIIIGMSEIIFRIFAQTAVFIRMVSLYISVTCDLDYGVNYA